MDGNQNQWQPDVYTGTVPMKSVAVPPIGPDGSITWTASEFIAHHKTGTWYATLAGAAIIGSALSWLITKDLITAIAIIGAAGLLAAYASRPPRELTYKIDGHGLQVANRLYRFDDFRSFSVMIEGAFSSIVFMPLKRFAPLLTVYYDPSDEAKIVDMLLEHLPLEARKVDLVDRLLWRIRF